jgi:hypothetical protein
LNARLSGAAETSIAELFGAFHLGQVMNNDTGTSPSTTLLPILQPAVELSNGTRFEEAETRSSERSEDLQNGY